MMKKAVIQHTGIIEKIEHPIVFVRIVQQAACSECHAKTTCVSSDRKIKIIEAEDYTGTFRVNEEVMICGQYTMGLYAVLLAYIIPLILVVAALVAGVELTGNEGIGGLAGLLVLLPYIIIMYMMRNKLKK
ncbi:MAG: SoxR reducing system RseC family protein, partial [Tannerella sp.]|nr:SoxR reducing system RseC family protein [Tannerella sp.]